MNAEYKIGLASVNDDVATGIAKEILDGTKAKLGFVPNMYRAMANSGGYLSTYVHGYNAFRQESGFTPIEQELIFLAAGYEEKQIMEVVLAIAVKTLSNYSNHIHHSEVDDAFASYAI